MHSIKRRARFGQPGQVTTLANVRLIDGRGGNPVPASAVRCTVSAADEGGAFTSGEGALLSTAR